MKTWEMIKELTERPYKVFRGTFDGDVIEITGSKPINCVAGNKFYKLAFDKQWTELQLAPNSECKHCNGDEEPFSGDFRLRYFEHQRKWHLTYKVSVMTEIEYCPKCGRNLRKLTEELL